MLTIATFNLCNLDAAAAPTRLARLGTIITHTLESPAILAVQEIMQKNTGPTEKPVSADLSYQALIAAVRNAGGPDYAYREVPPRADQDGGMTGANIRSGLLFDPLQVCFTDRGNASPEESTGICFSSDGPGLTLNPGRIAAAHPAFTGDSRRHWVPSRKALAAEFKFAQRRLFVIVCHFKSMRSLARREEDYAKKQRHAQAEVVYQFAADLLACDPQAAIILLGDFNDVLGSKTLKLLKGQHFHNLLEDYPPKQCYTRYHGHQPQALDHILISPSLRSGAKVRIPHVNTDAVSNMEPTSDHDPVLALLPALTEPVS